jgi:hypothetical protein
MELGGDQLLADAGLAQHQHRHRRGSDQLEVGADRADRRAAPDDRATRHAAVPERRAAGGLAVDERAVAAAAVADAPQVVVAALEHDVPARHLGGGERHRAGLVAGLAAEHDARAVERDRARRQRLAAEHHPQLPGAHRDVAGLARRAERRHRVLVDHHGTQSESAGSVELRLKIVPSIGSQPSVNGT